MVCWFFVVAVAHFRVGAGRTAFPRKPCDSRGRPAATAYQKRIKTLMSDTIYEAGSRYSPRVITYVFDVFSHMSIKDSPLMRNFTAYKPGFIVPLRGLRS